MAAYLDNPFRDWVEDSRAFGEAACKAYLRAWRAVEAIDPEAPDAPAAGEQALRTLAADLNTIDARYGLIDTIYRDQVGDVYLALAERLHIPEDHANGWFDDECRI